MDSFRSIIPFFRVRVNGQNMGKNDFEKLNGNPAAKSRFYGNFHKESLDKIRRIEYNGDNRSVAEAIGLPDNT